MKLLALLLLTVWVLAVLSDAKKKNKKGQPNIVFILADDWGWNDVSFHNATEVFTPTIQELADTGMILEQSYTTAWCTPSRAALVTGMYPHHIGRQSGVLKMSGVTGLTLEKKLVSDYLREAGYRNHLVGKWHLGHCNVAYLPTSRGFDTQFGFYNSHIANYYKIHDKPPYAWDFFKDDQLHKSLAVLLDHQGDLMETRIVELLNQEAQMDDNTPFFMFLPLPHVHWPTGETPFEFSDLYPHVEDFDRRNNLAYVSHFDAIIDTVVETLKDNDQYENSIIIITSDNGGYAYTWNWINARAGASNWPLRGEKGVYYEGGTRVNTVVHSPKYLDKNLVGTVSEDLMHVTDWAPTLLKAAGVDDGTIESYGFDGVDQYKTIFDGKKPAREEFIYNLWEEPEGSGVVIGAVRRGPWKLLNFIDDQPLGDWELYNVMDDPTESNNVAADNPDVVAELQEYFTTSASTMIPADKGLEIYYWLATDHYSQQLTNFCDTEGNSLLGEDSYKEGHSAGAGK